MRGVSRPTDFSAAFSAASAAERERGTGGNVYRSPGRGTMGVGASAGRRRRVSAELPLVSPGSCRGILIAFRMTMPIRHERVVLTACGLLFCTSAAAQEPARSATAASSWVTPAPTVPAVPQPMPAEQNGTHTNWYGWQALLIDGTALTLLAGSGTPSSKPSIAVTYVAVASYAIGPPIIHWAHGHVEAGIGSLALRTGLPLVAVTIATAGHFGQNCTNSESETDSVCLLTFVITTLASVVAAVAIDDALLAREDVPDRRTGVMQFGAFGISPTVGANQVGLVARAVF